MTYLDPVATATIAFAELHAGLARKRREGYLSEREYALTCRRFDHDWGAYVRVALDDDVLVLARDLVRRHPLRGFDAILKAARAERFRAIDVERALQAP